jgi:hypothetical protein
VGKSAAGAYNITPAYNMKDNLHPNAADCKLMAEAIDLPLLAKLRGTRDELNTRKNAGESIAKRERDE